MARRTTANDLHSRHEILAFTAPSDDAGVRAVLASPGPSSRSRSPRSRPLTFIAVVIVLGRQLALAVLMHDAAHRDRSSARAGSTKPSPTGCARSPLWNRRRALPPPPPRPPRPQRLRPRPQASRPPFPVHASSQWPASSSSAVTGALRVVGLLAMDLEDPRPTPSPPDSPPPARAARSASTSPRGAKKPRRRSVGHQRSPRRAPCALTGHGWVYVAWPVAYLNRGPGSFLRIRSIAEHACTEASTATRSATRARRSPGRIARLLVAPHRVGYHPGASPADDGAVLPAARAPPAPGRARRRARRGRAGPRGAAAGVRRVAG